MKYKRLINTFRKEKWYSTVNKRNKIHEYNSKYKMKRHPVLRKEVDIVIGETAVAILC